MKNGLLNWTRCLLQLCFFAAGVFINQKGALEKLFVSPHNKRMLVCGVVAGIIALVKKVWCNIASAVYGKSLVAYIVIALAQILAILVLSNKLCGCEKLKRFFAYLGRNSLIAFGLHSLGVYFYCFLLSIYRKEEILNGLNLSNAEVTFGSVFVLVLVVIMV